MSDKFKPRRGDCVWFASFHEALMRGEKKQPNGVIETIDWQEKCVYVRHIHQDYKNEVTQLEFSDMYGNWHTGYNCWKMEDY